MLAIAFREPTVTTFVTAFAVTLFAGLALWLPTRRHRDLHSRDGFMITVLFYLGLSLFGALPFIFRKLLVGSHDHSKIFPGFKMPPRSIAARNWRMTFI